jgi:hypothetical protein
MEQREVKKSEMIPVALSYSLSSLLNYASSVGAQTQPVIGA